MQPYYFFCSHIIGGSHCASTYIVSYYQIIIERKACGAKYLNGVTNKPVILTVFFSYFAYFNNKKATFFYQRSCLYQNILIHLYKFFVSTK